MALFALGAIIKAFSTFIGVSLLSDVLPLFSFILGITGAIAIPNVSEKGPLYDPDGPLSQPYYLDTISSVLASS